MTKLLVIASNINFLDWLKKMPYEVKIFKINLNVNKIRKAWFYISLKPKLRFLSRKYDIIFCDFFDNFSALMSRVSSKPMFVRVHRGEVDKPVYFKNANYNNIKAIITVSEHYKKVVSELTRSIDNLVYIRKFRERSAAISRSIDRPIFHRNLSIDRVKFEILSL